MIELTEIKKLNKIQFSDLFTLFIGVTMFANSLFFVDQSWFLIISIFFLGLNHYLKRYGNMKILLAVLFFWFFINFISIAFNRTSFSTITFLGYGIRISIAFFLVHSLNGLFWCKFEKIVFVLTSISLIIFGINLLIPSVFHELKVVFQPITNDVFLRKEAQQDFWNNFFYTHSGRDDGRNSGFMWEPGAFAMSSVIMIIINLSNKGIIITRRILIYILAIISTFSTAGYISLMFLILAYLFNRKIGVLIFGIFITFLVFNSRFLYSDFLIPKVEGFIEEAGDDIFYDQIISERLEANRISYFQINLLKAMQFPLGYGIVEDAQSFSSIVKVVGVGGLSDILYKWGFLGFFVFIYLIWKVLILYFSKNLYLIQIIFVLFSILIVFFSNPIESNLIGFMFGFTYFLRKYI